MKWKQTEKKAGKPNFMNRIHTVLSLLFFLFHFSGFSQNMLKGTVTDSLQNPLPFANIIAEPQDSLNEIKFAITGGNGRYKLELKKIPYTITASYMGYESFSFQLNPTKNTVKNIVLKQKAEGLKSVVLEIPMVVKEDTIIYNVETFMTGEERKLKDILKKLPGVEVARDGTVKVNGKTVTTLLVENKKFFGGGTKLGVENIPADAVDQVEVLDNYNPIAFLKNFRESDQMALNIKLKEGKKNFVFGDVEAGKGNKDFYRAHANLFYYSPTTVFNVIGNLNNTGEEVFTYKQYFDFQGGINKIFMEGNTDFDLSNNDLLQFIEMANVIESERKFGALNFSQKVNNKLNLSAYGIFSETQEGTLIQSINQYNSFTETTEIASNNDNLFAIGNLKVVYLPSLTDEWYFKTQFKKIDNQYGKNITSRIDTTLNVFLTNKDLNDTYFNQVIEWHRQSSKEHTFSFVASYTFNERSPRTFWSNTNPFLEGLIPLIEQPIYNVKQLKRIKNNRLDIIFKHYWVLNKNNHIYSTLGNTYLNQQFFTRDFQELEDGSINEFNSENFGNDLDFNLNDLFIGLHYKFKTGIFTFDQGAFLHHYHWKAQQKNDITKNKFVLLPNFSAEAQIGQLKELEFNYEIKSSFSDASKFANKYYLQSYNRVFRGNENLENELSHNFRLRYTKFSTYRGIRIYAYANYSKQIKGVKNAVEYEGVNQKVMPFLLDNPETRWSFFGNITKKFKDINVSLGVRDNASKYIQKINETLKTNKANHFSYEFAAETLFDNFPIIEIGFRQSMGTYSLSGQEWKFVTSEPYLHADYNFLKGFIASFDYTAYRYKNKSLNQRNTYQLANASLYYRKESSAWSFKLEAQNLFNVEFKNRNSFSSYLISDTKTYILPRIIMFTIGYKL